MTSPQPGPDWHTRTTQAVITSLETDLTSGLSASEAKKRLTEHGANVLQVAGREHWYHILARQFLDVLITILLIAAFISLAIGEIGDAITIFAIIILNGVLGFVQEWKAEKALEALAQMLASKCSVVRDGREQKIEARTLVPGDIVMLEIGDRVPADLRLVDAVNLKADESALTGESISVHKDTSPVALDSPLAGQRCMVWMGTSITNGRAHGVVIATGMDTEFGRIARLTRDIETETTPLQRKLAVLGKQLGIISVGISVVVGLTGWLLGKPLLEMFFTGVSLAVAVVPEGLPAVVTITLALGVRAMVRRRALLRRLQAAEALGAATVVCTDKTGTLTENRMQVAEPVLLNNHWTDELFQVAALASRLESNDPIELPIFHYIDEHLPDIDLGDFRQTQYTPFDPVRKRTEAHIEHGDEQFSAIKSAAQILIELAELPDGQALNVRELVNQLASKGYRTLAVGRKNGDAPLELIGLIPLYDPPRTDSRQVITDMRDYGVRVKMVTGDHIAIAREVGRLMGLEGEAIRSHQLTGSGSQELLALVSTMAAAIYERLKGDVSRSEARHFSHEVMEIVDELYDTRLLDREFIHTHESAIIEMIEDVDLFAEVVPEDKYRIVDTLQKAGHIVAMTGDGVNDAPALKRTDCGFAVSSATDAARAAADIILRKL